jgi:uncharacterized protein (DUF4415 family)
MMQKLPTRTRRPTDPFKAAEAAFKKAPAKPAKPAPKAPSIPGAKEMVPLRIDRDVLDFFQEEGPGWQERINEALRKAAGKSSTTPVPVVFHPSSRRVMSTTPGCSGSRMCG